jgi:hypothetical protein
MQILRTPGLIMFGLCDERFSNSSDFRHMTMPTRATVLGPVFLARYQQRAR